MTGDETVDMDRRLTDLAAAYEHHQAVQRRHHSTFVRENGRKGGSPWGELMEALEAVLDARHAAMAAVRPQEARHGDPAAVVE